MSEAILELFGVVSPWLLLLLIPLYFWSRVVHKSLNSKDTHPESFERTVGWLRGNSFGQLYLQFLGWLLDGVSRLIGDRSKPEHANVTLVQQSNQMYEVFGFNPFSPRSFNFCMMLAFLYPSFAFVIMWVLGSSGEFQGEYVALLALSALFVGALAGSFAMKTKSHALLAFPLVFMVLSLGIIVLRVFDVKDSIAVPIVAIFTIFIPIILVNFKLNFGEISGKTMLIYWWVVFLLSTGFLSIIADVNYLVTVLFFMLLPLVNAPLDWLSLGVTRGLLQAMRSGHHKGLGALGFAVVDLLLALVFLFLITAVLVGVTALGNAVAGKTLVDIHGILSGIKGNPASVDHWWIYFMLLSTLVPTLIHFALAGGAATLWLPRKWRLQIADGLERDIHKTFAAWAYLTFTPVIGFIVVPGLLLYCLWWLVTTHDAWLGMHLLNWAQMLADFANPQVTTP